MEVTDEVQMLAEAILEAADVAGLGVTVSYDDGQRLQHVYVNDAASQIFGYPSGDLVGRETSVPFAPEERGRLEELASRWRRGESIASVFESKCLRGSGERIPIEVAVSVVNLAGEPAIVAFLRDIRERKAAEAKLAFADRLAVLGRLAAGVAHEINNPLGYATLSIESLGHQMKNLDEASSCGVEEALATAREGLARVGAIVRDLLCLSSPANEERWPVHVSSVLESAVNIAMHEVRGRARLVRRYGDVPALKTDPSRLGQIFLNLLFNAAQSFPAADETGNEIRLDISSADPDCVTITIGDNGRGIGPQELQHIFEPFYTTKATGTGLGLAICQMLVTSLGGRIEVESVVGVGSTFTVRLPVPAPR